MNKDYIDYLSLVKVSLIAEKDVLKDQMKLKKDIVDFYNYILSTKFSTTQKYDKLLSERKDKVFKIRSLKWIVLLLTLLYMTFVPSYVIPLIIVIIDNMIAIALETKVQYELISTKAMLDKINTQQDITYKELDIVNTRLSEINKRIREYENIVDFGYDIDEKEELPIILPTERNPKIIGKDYIRILKR